MSSINKLRRDLQDVSNKERVVHSQRFFKTGKGEYGEGDVFVGATVPSLRKLSKQYKNLVLEDIGLLLKSKIHEERLLALFVLVLQFKKGSENDKEQIYKFYLANTKHINNWDLVDSSAGYIVGAYLYDKDRSVLLRLAESKDLWERRIAMIATSYFITKGESEWTFKIAKILIKDKHDLIQKAVGWMLREVGKRWSTEVEEVFLKENYGNMGRTCLRYAIERFPEEKRVAYLKGMF